MLARSGAGLARGVSLIDSYCHRSYCCSYFYHHHSCSSWDADPGARRAGEHSLPSRWNPPEARGSPEFSEMRYPAGGGGGAERDWQGTN